MGVWRILGYVYAGLNILGGFILIAGGARIISERGLDTQSTFGAGFSEMINQIQGFGLMYGGLAAIMVGILLIWALVKSGQIENIDKNIKIIAEWAKSQMQKEGLSPNQLKEEKSEQVKQIDDRSD